MEVVRSNAFGQLDPKRLEAFEARIGSRFPEDFREFLLAHNGGCPSPDNFVFPGVTEPFTCLHHTYGLHDGPSYYRMDTAFENLREFLPIALVALADDPGGNEFCIGLSGEHRGRVYFWDHERAIEEEGHSYFGNITLLADSFAEFLQRLHPFVEE